MTYHRPAWVEVDLSAIKHNVGAFRSLLDAHTMFMAVVKGDGYGHGAVQVARAALSAGAVRLGVATFEEAYTLRSAGITAQIHLLAQPPDSAAELILEHDLVPAAYSATFLQALDRAARRFGKIARYHLKIDSGMNRVGVRAEEAAEFAASLQMLDSIALEGTFTHFATSEVPGDWDFDSQLQRFQEALAEMRTEGVDPGIVHSANTGATILHPETHMDMVRCGIGMYGLHPGPATRARIDLCPAMSVKAEVAHVKRIGLGEGVSYGLVYRAPGPITIATLPLGYADGVHRVLSERMSVLIDGRRCRQVGRICMDQLMVEIPDGMTVRAGDEAVLVGPQGRERIRVDDLAEQASTINHEIVCSFALRLPRRFA